MDDLNYFNDDQNDDLNDDLNDDFYDELEDGLENESEDDDIYNTIVLTDDNGDETEFIMIDSVEMDGDTYLLLVKSDEAEDDESYAYIFKRIGVGDGDDDDEVIFEEPTEEEFERVSELFKDSSDDFDFDI